MVRDFSKDFEGKCCEDDFRTCDWTCAEIQRRIETRAGKGTVYTRAEVDSRIQTVTSLYSTIVGAANLIFNTELFLITEGVAAGLLDPVNNGGNFFFATDTNDLYVCDGTSWIIVVDFSAFQTALDPSDVMLKTVYDDPVVLNQNNAISIAAGGLNADNTSSQGILTFQSGTPTFLENYLPLSTGPANPLIADVNLLFTDNPVQVLYTNNDFDVILPVLPPTYSWFRIINKLGTNTLTVRVDVGGTILIELNAANGLAADFHWDGNEWSTILQTLV